MGIVACECIIYPDKVDSIRKSAGKEMKKVAKAGKQTRSDAQCFTITAGKAEQVVETPANKIDNNIPDELYEEVLAFLETGRYRFSRTKNIYSP